MVTTLKIGLTGGIGSGKSTVGKLLCQSRGILIDADVISKAITAPRGLAIEQIRSVFGPELITERGALDRVKMRALVFDDPSTKLQLESIIHPLVHREICLQSATAEAAGCPCIIFDIPLLIESKHWRKAMHRILVVDCSEQTQISRVVERDALPRQTIEKIILTQASRLTRISAADMVLFNDGISLQSLASEVQQINTQIGL